MNKYMLFDGFTYNVHGYFASKNTTQKIRAMSKMSARTVLSVKPLIKVFIILLQNDFVILLFWLLFSGKSVEIHAAMLALSVHQYMARPNDVNNTESQ